MTNWLPSWTEITWTHGLRILAILIGAIILTRLLRGITARIIQRAPAQTRAAQFHEQQTRRVAGLLYGAGTPLILIAALLLVLPEFGFDLRELVAAAGLVSIAVGFSAQSLLKDLINGFFIISECQFVVGDLIQLNNETGRVEHLTLRRTVIRNAAGAIVNIPNSLVGQVANLSRDWSQVFVDVTVPADEAVGRALALLEKIAGEFRGDATWSLTLLDGPRVLGVESFSLDGTILRLQVRTILNHKDDVARELRRRIHAGFEQARVPLSHTHKVDLQSQIAPGSQAAPAQNQLGPAA